MAEFQALIKQFPEFIEIAFARQGQIHQVDCHDSLIKSAVIFRFSRLRIHIRGQEASAAHAGIAMAFTVLIHFTLHHDLLADVIRHHSLSRTFGRKLCQVEIRRTFCQVILLQHVNQLRECRCHPDSLLILHPLVALKQCLLDNHRQILFLLPVPRFIEVHKHSYKRSLSVGCHQCHNLILDSLNAAADLFFQTLIHHFRNLFLCCADSEAPHLLLNTLADFPPAHIHKGSQMGQADALSSVLAAGNLGDNLSGDVTGS